MLSLHRKEPLEWKILIFVASFIGGRFFVTHALKTKQNKATTTTKTKSKQNKNKGTNKQQQKVPI